MSKKKKRKKDKQPLGRLFSTEKKGGTRSFGTMNLMNIRFRIENGNVASDILFLELLSIQSRLLAIKIHWYDFS